MIIDEAVVSKVTIGTQVPRGNPMYEINLVGDGWGFKFCAGDDVLKYLDLSSIKKLEGEVVLVKYEDYAVFEIKRKKTGKWYNNRTFRAQNWWR